MLKRSIQIILILFMLFCIEQNSIAQQLKYNIKWLGTIGKLIVSKSVADNALVIETNSEVKVPFYRLNWITTTTSRDGILQNSNYRQLLNDKKREFTEINFSKEQLWELTDSEGQKKSIDIAHQFYVSRLYFEEPIDQKYIFSERFGKSLELINHGNGHYKLLLPDDNYVEYFYDDGVCTLVKAKNGNKTIKMVLSEQS